MPLTFGSFASFCDQAPLPICPLVAPDSQPRCYARNLELGTILFQPATLVMYLAAIVMAIVMLAHINVKYTAIGRKEIMMFFVLYIFNTALEFFLYSGIIPVYFAGYQYFVAAQIGMMSATIWCLLLNGFVGFRWVEDGTSCSLWGIRLSSLIVFAISFFVSIATTLGFIPSLFNSSQPMGLFIVYFIFPLGALAIWLLLQLILVFTLLDDRWPLGALFLGSAFFTASQLCILVFSSDLCDVTSHYVDGLFFGALCSLLSVMMIYKFWGDITKEDLEFSVGGKSRAWELSDYQRTLVTGSGASKYETVKRNTVAR